MTALVKGRRIASLKWVNREGKILKALKKALAKRLSKRKTDIREEYDEKKSDSCGKIVFVSEIA